MDSQGFLQENSNISGRADMGFLGNYEYLAVSFIFAPGKTHDKNGTIMFFFFLKFKKELWCKGGHVNNKSPCYQAWKSRRRIRGRGHRQSYKFNLIAMIEQFCPSVSLDAINRFKTVKGPLLSSVAYVNMMPRSGLM